MVEHKQQLKQKTRVKDGKVIKIRSETHQRLTRMGSKSESFDDIINRLLDAAE